MAYSSKQWVKDLLSKVLKKVLPFRLGIDEDGNYGYYKAGADTLTPFKSGGDITIASVTVNNKTYIMPKDAENVYIFSSIMKGDGYVIAKINGNVIDPNNRINITPGNYQGLGISYSIIKNVKKDDIIETNTSVAYVGFVIVF